MRIDAIVLIVVFTCIALALGTFGLITYWMRKIHTDLLSQFALLHSLFLLDKHEKKGSGCRGEEYNN